MSIGRFAVVAIGRNEGLRLRSCLESVMGNTGLVVYVDSGSTDGSVAMARGLGSEVIELDMRFPFTAARARNEGFARVRQLAPDLPYVQFVDGDCEVVAGWFDAAVAFLDSYPDVAAVCGRRRERYPGRSVYNMLCDMEWNTPVGEARACGGDVMMRAVMLAAVDGYRANLIAGEEPELCVRLRAAGWRIRRLDKDMTLHDAAMERFGQWWKRTKRAGYAYAEGAALHGAPPERHWVRESRSAWFWGAAIPVIVIGAVTCISIWGMALLAIYPIQVIRLAMRGKQSKREKGWHAIFLVLGKFPEALGQLKFHVHRLFGKRSNIIEYK